MHTPSGGKLVVLLFFFKCIVSLTVYTLVWLMCWILIYHKIKFYGCNVTKNLKINNRNMNTFATNCMSTRLTSKPLLSASMKTCSQTELENWITAIHSACATAVARQHHREDTVRLLRAEIKKLEQKIDMDEKMKKMGEMQLSAVTDTKKRKTILDQVGFITPHSAGLLGVIPSVDVLNFLFSNSSLYLGQALTINSLWDF